MKKDGKDYIGVRCLAERIDALQLIANNQEVSRSVIVNRAIKEFIDKYNSAGELK